MGRCGCASVLATGAAAVGSGCISVTGAGTPASPFSIGLGASCVIPVVCTSSTRPAAPTSGQIIFETNTGRTYVWTGSQWARLAAGNVVDLKTISATVGPLGAGPTAIAGLSLTATLIAGHYYRLAHYFEGLSSTAQPETWSVWLTDGGSQVQTRDFGITETATGQGGGVTEMTFLAASSTSKTYSVSLARATGSGSGTFLASGVAPSHLVLQDLGL